MTRATLLALASRVEAATGADREMDAQVWLACVPGTTRNELCYIHKASSRECVIDETRDANRRLIVVPAYTASLDAAMSLVPSGWVIGSLDWWQMRKESGVTLFETGDLAGSGWECHGYDNAVHKNARAASATPALALTAASLRAIAGSMTDD